MNGIKDYTEDGVSGCCINPRDVNQMIDAVKKMRDDDGFRNQCGVNNAITAKTFDIRNTEAIMNELYSGSMKLRGWV